MPPVVAIVGAGNAGKTTYVTKLVVELKSRGYHVATVKHTPSGMVFDDKNKDTGRHLQAGSELTAASSPDKVVIVKPVARELSLEEVVRLLGEDWDIVLAEGFKQSDVPKIEVHRKSAGAPLSGLTRLIAIATDEPLQTPARQFSLDDVRGVADLIEKGFIQPQKDRISLYVNDRPVALNSFAQKIITSTIIGIATSLKGVDEVQRLDISIRKENNSDRK